MKNNYVNNIKIGNQIDDIFVIINRNIGQKKDGNLFANVILGDRTGQIKAIMWENVEVLLSGISLGDLVKVRGSIGEYRGILQMNIKNIRLVVNKEKINPYDFLSTSEKDINFMFEKIKKITKSINNKYLKKLMNLFFDDNCFTEKFKTSPAAKRVHHAYIGGLLEHSLSMALLGDQISMHYEGIDRDLLISGIILHDIGKIKELSYKYNIDYTDDGRLLSHIVIGIIMIDEKIKQIPNFSKETELLLKHLIISHHGSKEFGSPEVPKTIEAILLNCIDDMDFKVNSVKKYLQNDSNMSSWTSYDQVMERQFYKGKNFTS